MMRIILSLVLLFIGMNVVLPKIGDARKIAKFEKTAQHDRINRDFKWADHVGYYSDSGAKLCSDICLALLYSGRVKTVTSHRFAGADVTQSDRFWLEKRDVCPDASKMSHQSYPYELSWVRKFHATMGLCLIMGEATALVEPMQIIWKVDTRPLLAGDWTSRLSVLKSGNGLDQDPQPDDILAQRTTVRYQDTPRFRIGLYAGPGMLTTEKTFNSRKIHQRYTGGGGYSFSHFPRVGIRPIQALRYITNLGEDGLETLKHSDQKNRLESVDDLVPSKEAALSSISQEFSKLKPSDFPLANRYKLFLRYIESRKFSTLDENALRDAQEELSAAVMHASTQELIFLTPKMNFNQLSERDNFENPNIRYRSTRNFLNYPAYKKAIINFTKAAHKNKLKISRDHMEYKHYELANSAISKASQILVYDEFNQDFANVILDIVIRHEGKDFGFKEVLEKHSWKNTEAVDALLKIMETGALSKNRTRDNLDFLSYMSKESLSPYKDRVQAAITRHGGIKSTTTRKRMSNKLNITF